MEVLNTDRLTVLKEYMSLSDMKDYFGLKDTRTFSDWEKKGLKAIYLNEKIKYYKANDIREFLNSFS